MGKPISATEMGELCDHAATAAGRKNRAPYPAAGAANPDRPLWRRRALFGKVLAEARQAAEPVTDPLSVRPSAVALVTPLIGAVSVVSAGERRCATPGATILLTRAGSATAAWAAASVGLVLYLPRAGLQSAASAQLGDARRFANLCVAMSDGSLTRLTEAFETLVTSGADCGDRDSIDVETPLCTALVQAIAGRSDADRFFPIARSVTQAMRHVRDNLNAPCDAARLARVVGVTPDTLRTGFRTCLGVGLADYVWQARLTWARERLNGCHESRSIRELAVLAGFRDAAAFSRAYLRTFHEAPTETRSRAVRSMN